MNKKVVLIDGHSILNRAFYGIPNLSNSEGIHTNGVYGFLNIMFKVLDEEKADYLAVAFDVSAPTFRHEMFPEYKGTRKPMPEELREQVPLIKDVLKSMNITILEKPEYEADDILGTLGRRCEEHGYDVSIISGDRDLLQLATQKVKIRIPKTKMGGTEVEDYYWDNVIEKYQVTPVEFIDLKALMGDASDNIPGVPGIGEKTATKIITEYHSIEAAYEHADEIKPKKASENLKNHYDMAQMSKALAAINTHCELDFCIEHAGVDQMYNENSYALFKRLEFKNIMNRFDMDVRSANEESQISAKNVDLLNEAENIIRKISHETRVGLCLIGQDTAVGLSIASDDGQPYFIPVSESITEDRLKSWIRDILRKAKQVAVMDFKTLLYQLGGMEETGNIFDLGVAGYLLNPLKDTYNYDDIARDYLGQTLPSRIDLFGKVPAGNFYPSRDEAFFNYAAYLSWIPLKAYSVMKDRLEEENMLDLFYTMEMPLVYTLYDMESEGIMVEKEALKVYGDQLAVRINELETDIYALAGETFNINSPKQLGVILFEKLRLPFGKKTKTGYSTSADILEKLKSEDPIVRLILEYRQLAKLKSTYADGLAVYINEEDQRIHTRFNQTITATGRISSTEPNLQNIPIRMELGRLIRKVFIPKGGCVFVDADYSQIELRVLAHMSQDKTLIQAYKTDQDIHKITASQVFNTPLDEVTPAQRSNAKAVNFGIVYGISSFGLSQDLSITRKEAEAYIKQYFHTYPDVKKFLDDSVAHARENGYVQSMFHRRRPVPELKSSNFMQRSFGERVAMNSPIQGTAADIIKLAMIYVNRSLKEQGLKSRLILQVHDELLIETYKDELEQVTRILKYEMMNAAHLDVPLEIDINIGNNWYEAK